MPPSSSDERIEDMETESTGPNPSFGATKGYYMFFSILIPSG